MADDYAWLHELLAQNRAGGGTSSDGSMYDASGITGGSADAGASSLGGLLGLLGQNTAAAKPKVTTPNYGSTSSGFPSGQPRPEAAMFKKYLGQNQWQDLKKFNFK